jgi:hypothetical protein
MTGETGFGLSEKYRAFIDNIIEYRTLRKRLLGYFVGAEGRLKPSWGFYDLRIGKSRRERMLKKATDENIHSRLLDVVTSIYPLEALARKIMSEQQITAQDVKHLISLNDSLRRHWTQYNWIPTAVAAAAFFVVSELPHDLIKEVLSQNGYALYARVVLWVTGGMVVVALGFLAAMFQITSVGGATLMFDQIDVLLKLCRVLVDDPPNEGVAPRPKPAASTGLA